MDIGDLGINLLQNLKRDSECDEGGSEHKRKSDSKSEGKNETPIKVRMRVIISSKNGSDGEKKENMASKAASDLSPDQFHLLQKFGVHSNFMDTLLQELVKYNGQNTIEYMQGNNRNGYLVPQPSLCTLKNMNQHYQLRAAPFLIIL